MRLPGISVRSARPGFALGDQLLVQNQVNFGELARFETDLKLLAPSLGDVEQLSLGLQDRPRGNPFPIDQRGIT